MASVQEMVERKLDKIDAAVQKIREELEQRGDFDAMVEAADSVSEQGDALAEKLQKVSQAMGDDPEEALQADESEADGDDEEQQSKSSGSKRKRSSSR